MIFHKVFKRIAFIVLIFLFVNSVDAQSRAYDTTTVNLMNEITRLQGYFYNTPYVSFDASLYMSDIDTVTVLDTLTFKFKLNNDSINVVMANNSDTVETIQNQYYSGTIYHDDSTIVVQRPEPFTKKVFQVDVNDTLFKFYSLSSMTVTDSLCYRLISMNFDSTSLYKSYKLAYCKNNFNISYIVYSVRKESIPNTTKLLNIVIRFTNYQTGTFGPSVFSTDGYFKVNNATDIQLAQGIDPYYDIVNLLEH